jgi:hypothetical protein
MLDGSAASCAFDVGTHAVYVVYAGGWVSWFVVVVCLCPRCGWCGAMLCGAVYGEYLRKDCCISCRYSTAGYCFLCE